MYYIYIRYGCYHITTPVWIAPAFPRNRYTIKLSSQFRLFGVGCSDVPEASAVPTTSAARAFTTTLGPATAEAIIVKVFAGGALAASFHGVL